MAMATTIATTTMATITTTTPLLRGLLQCRPLVVRDGVAGVCVHSRRIVCHRLLMATQSFQRLTHRDVCPSVGRVSSDDHLQQRHRVCVHALLAEHQPHVKSRCTVVGVQL